jgi:type VI secretion system secreted protein Hcp
VSEANLIKLCGNGKHFQKAKLTIRKAGGPSPVEYIKIELNDGLISGVSSSGSGGEERLTETVTLNFASFNYEYTPQSASGSGSGSIPAKWNIAKNAES